MKENEIRKNYASLTRLLIEKKLSITTMESATSGQIASLITDTEGSSAILKGAFITYSNEAKIKNGVSEKIIQEFSVYSKETAIEMATSCAKFYGANIGIGVTGTMGNTDPENPAFSVPGNVYFAISFNEKVTAFHFELKNQPTRLQYKLEVAQLVYQELIKIIA